MAEPIVHHRGADFRVVYERASARLQAGLPHRARRAALHRVRHGRVGVGGREPLAPGDRVLAVSRRLVRRALARAREGLRRRRRPLDYEWGETPTADDVAARLRERGRRRRVLLDHSETSTGVVADIRALAAAAKEAGALSVVDAVSSLGAVPLETDEWGLDVVVSGSQKALMYAARARDGRRLRARVGAARARRRASTSTGSRRARRSRSSTPPSRRPSR